MGPDRDILAPQHRLTTDRPSNLIQKNEEFDFQKSKASLGSSRDSYTARRKGGKGTTFQMHRTEYISSTKSPKRSADPRDNDYESTGAAASHKNIKNWIILENQNLSYSPMQIDSKPILSGKNINMIS